MVIDLVPQFLDAIGESDPVRGYRRYFEDHRPVLAALWHNHISDPDDPHVDQLVHRLVNARRDDLRALLNRVDVKQIAEDSLARCEEMFQTDCPVDLYLLIGVGAAVAGELVMAGRGGAFVCLEHFTGRLNPETLAAGLAPRLLPLWIAHGVAHAVRYTSPTSRSELARIVCEAGGVYDLWDSGSQAPLKELLINEGLAVAASRAVAPGFGLHQYLDYSSRQYRRLRGLEAFLRRIVHGELDQSGLGLRLRYLSRGVPTSSRRVQGKVIPERSGYYVGYRMAESYVARHGIAQGLRASAEDCLEADRRATGEQSV